MSTKSWNDDQPLDLTKPLPIETPMSGDREKYIALGMNGYVSKSIDQTELIGEINRATGVMPGKIPLNSPETNIGDGEIEPRRQADSPQVAAECDIADLLEMMDRVAPGLGFMRLKVNGARCRPDLCCPAASTKAALMP